MYKRKTTSTSKPHSIQTDYSGYGQISILSDPGWIQEMLQELHDDGKFALGQFSRVIATIKKRDLSEYRLDVARKKQNDDLQEAKKSFMSFLSKHIKRAKSNHEAVKNKILRMTEPETPSDPVKAMLMEMKNQEIRSLIRNLDPKIRLDVVRGKPDYLKAVISSPDQLIHPDGLLKIRRDYAFSIDESLEEEEKDAQLIYRAIRRRAGEINATSTKMLVDVDLDDPTPPKDYFEAFPPESDYEKYHAEKRIETYEKEKMAEERRKQFEDRDTGINLEVGERATRIRRRSNIHHEEVVDK